jgi:hypothetical protein
MSLESESALHSAPSSITAFTARHGTSGPSGLLDDPGRLSDRDRNEFQLRERHSDLHPRR